MATNPGEAARRPWRGAAGVTFVELLVAVAIGAVLLALVSQGFFGFMRSKTSGDQHQIVIGEAKLISTRFKKNLKERPRGWTSGESPPVWVDGVTFTLADGTTKCRVRCPRVLMAQNAGGVGGASETYLTACVPRADLKLLATDQLKMHGCAADLGGGTNECSGTDVPVIRIYDAAGTMLRQIPSVDGTHTGPISAQLCHWYDDASGTLRSILRFEYFNTVGDASARTTTMFSSEFVNLIGTSVSVSNEVHME